ncbi:MAG: tetratricopeptide repeat protein [Humidesulfovibrio sp.]|uniref:tetratricopeptide repeat protein n=1 Tax=Humidesulfovibrio sp. TaxID=2910988 RepID=UPI0027FA9060|nr:tetratricopeptide repeat protein [Humidesulfovibrio sp.]MDQ7834690.1 tetratricopeptide repeat protein [Humidesulfovibrio sp.]
MSATTSHLNSPAPLGAGRKFVLAALLAALFAMFVGSFVYRMQGAGLVVEIKQERGPMGGKGGMGGVMGGIDMEHLRELMQEVDKNPNDPRVLLELGNTFMMMQAWDKALEYLDKAVKTSPDDPQVHRAMGMVRFERKEYPQARKSFETVLKKEPGDVMAHYNMGILLKHYLKLPAEGDAHFRKVVQLGSASPEITKSAEQELAAAAK